MHVPVPFLILAGIAAILGVGLITLAFRFYLTESPRRIRGLLLYILIAVVPAIAIPFMIAGGDMSWAWFMLVMWLVGTVSQIPALHNALKNKKGAPV